MPTVECTAPSIPPDAGFEARTTMFAAWRLFNAPSDLTESGERFFVGRGLWMSAVDADEVSEALTRGKHRSGRDADLFGKGALVEFQRGNVRGQFDPQNESTRRLRGPRACGEGRKNDLAGTPHLGGQQRAEGPQMVIVSTIREELRGSHLRE